MRIGITGFCISDFHWHDGGGDEQSSLNGIKDISMVKSTDNDTESGSLIGLR